MPIPTKCPGDGELLAGPYLSCKKCGYLYGLSESDDEGNAIAIMRLEREIEFRERIVRELRERLETLRTDEPADRGIGGFDETLEREVVGELLRQDTEGD